MGIFSRALSKKSERVLLFDINSASVSVAHVELSGGIPLVTQLVNTPILVSDQISLAELEKNMQAALLATLTALQKFSLGHPDSILVCLASPWYASQVRLAKLSRPSPFPVTRRVLDDMISREIQAFTEEEVKQAGPDPLSQRESRTLAVRLNGYNTTDPIGHSASELEISLFLAVCSERLKKGIEDAMEHFYHKRKVIFSSFLSTTYLVARTLLPHEQEYVLIDVGGEVTDVSLVRDGVLYQTASFPKARNAVIRKLATTLSRSKEEALSLWKLSLEGKLDGPVAESCAAALKEAKKEWLAAFSAALFSISDDLSIPHTILITVDNDTSGWFIDTVKDEEFHQYTRTETEFRVMVLDSSLFHGSVFFAPNVPHDPAITIEVIGLSYLRKQGSGLQ